MEKALLLINPVSGHGKARIHALESVNVLKKNFNLDIIESKYAGHPLEIAEESSGYQVIISAGGDGTVHEVVNGLMRSGLNKTVILAILPVGNGNDSARAIGMPFNHLKAAEEICHKNISLIDVGKMNDIYFSNSLGLGMDARVAKRAVDLREKTSLRGVPLYLKALFEVISDWETYVLAIEANGFEFFGEITLIASNIGRTYGGGFFITPDAFVNDGLLDICLIEKIPVYQIPFRVPFIIFGKHLWMKKVHYFKSEKVKFLFEKEVFAQLDGEVYEVKKGEISIVKDALTVYSGKRGFFRK